MSEIEFITDGGRRRRWSGADKLWIVEETLLREREHFDDNPEVLSSALRR